MIASASAAERQQQKTYAPWQVKLMASTTPFISTDREEENLAAKIRESTGTSGVVQTTLKTDQRVIARVTDGIYRQPGSALRELISNAYDADATRVTIKTDAPRFEKILVEDDGHGMTAEALAHLLSHIGGSAKRSESGAALGVTSEKDPSFSPGGRRLIGKIGIGLFSVSQLTHTFQIITKTKGDNFRIIATVALKQYADSASDETVNTQKYESGKVNIWREKAADKDSHGTSIILTSIRPQARDTLRSREIWSAIEQNESQLESEEKQEIEPPHFHIGRLDNTEELLRKNREKTWSLPWNEGDNPELAFKKLVQAVWDELDHSTPNPRLDRVFDYYLRMIWQLSLAVPLPYVEEHLFDTDPNSWARAFLLSNQPKGGSEEIISGAGTLRKRLNLKDPTELVGKFDVFVDELKLSRPIKYKGLPETNNALKHPLIFIGKCREDFNKFPRELSGGPLAFEAYLFWTPKIAPVEHQGALIRIHGSSGTLFDSTFLRYQVSEQTRLRQITCEIFVSEGLDSALNIDRESFNNAHPHSVYLTKWLHSALRQVASTQKRLAQEVRSEAIGQSKKTTVSSLNRIARDAWRKEVDDPGGKPPNIDFSETGKKTSASGEAYVYSRSAVLPLASGKQTNKAKARASVLEEKLKTIAQILASYGLLDAVSKKKQEALLKAIYQVLVTPGE